MPTDPACQFRHIYNTTTSGTGPAGFADFNGTGGDASISKPVYVTSSWVDQNNITLNREGGTSKIRVFVKGSPDDWGSIPLTSNTIFNALADARSVSPDIVPTRVYSAVIDNYDATPLNEQAWVVDITYSTQKPKDPGGNESEENPNGDEMGEVDTTYKGSTSLQSIPLSTARYVIKSAGLLKKDIYNNSQFKKAQNGVVSPTTVSVQTPIQSYQVEKSYAPGTITKAFLKTVGNLTGKLNQGAFAGFGIRDVLFLGADYAFDKVNKEMVTYKFGIREGSVEHDVPMFDVDQIANKRADFNKLTQEELLGAPGKAFRTDVRIGIGSGWDYVQYSFMEHTPADNKGAKSVMNRMSLLTGYQVLATYSDGDFDDLGLGL